MNSNFYEQIPPIHDIAQITDPQHYHNVPEDWYIALTDVQGSTQAIQAGRYKDVNAVAVASIAALLNLADGHDLPFVFGGDGATVLFPPTLYDKATQALVATRQLATTHFNLTMRVGIVPVKLVLAAGYGIQVARLKMSDVFQQAIFTGGGLGYAEQLLKNDQRHWVAEIEGAEADFQGFECRWNEIPSPHEETISLMVTAIQDDLEQRNTTYRAVIEAINTLYGDSTTRHPLRANAMRLSLFPHQFSIEARIRQRSTSLRLLWQMAYKTFLARIAMRFSIGNWGLYKPLLVGATDHEKFDDTLRMTIAGTRHQRQQLRDYLETERQHKHLIYGMHTARHALMTCIVYDYFGRQMHFIDASGGGYALAAQEMKLQKSQLSEL